MRSHIVIPETDDSSAFRLSIAWRATLDVLALANQASGEGLAHSAARVRAERALDVYFAALDACLEQRLI